MGSACDIDAGGGRCRREVIGKISAKCYVGSELGYELVTNV